MSAEKCGYDIESRDPATGRLRFLEVKGRRADADSVTVTRNETLVALNSRNQPHEYILAIVLVEQGFARRTAYIRDPFSVGVDDTTDRLTHDLRKLLGPLPSPGRLTPAPGPGPRSAGPCTDAFGGWTSFKCRRRTSFRCRLTTADRVIIRPPHRRIE